MKRDDLTDLTHRQNALLNKKPEAHEAGNHFNPINHAI